MRRREFLALAALPAAAEATTLVHEHVMVDFTGGSPYDADEVFRVARPKIEEVARLGCRRILECTPAFLGRDPKLLARLQDATGVALCTNTGIYGAAGHKFVPEFARAENAERLARRWIAEVRAGTGRFIKIGVNRSPLDEIDRKLVRAAAIASRETGLTIQSHTGDGRAAMEQLEIVAEERLQPARFVWVHAQNEKDHGLHEKAARAGAWVSLDGIGPKSADRHLECVRFMASKGLLGRTLISQDAGWYHVGEPGGGAYRGYTYLYTDFLPRLEPAWVKQLLVTNPAAAFPVQ